MAPSLKKYVKKMVNNSMSFDEGVMQITETCSQIIQSNMPKKHKDPGAFVLSCTIGHLTFERSLCDLGSSVNLMPLSVAKRLGFSAFHYTNLTLVLADRSTRKPVGILEDVPMKVGNCWIPADFIVLDYENQEPKDPIILGRPFLATVGAVINCKESIITLSLDGKTMEFDMNKMLKRPTVDGHTFVVKGIEEVAELESNLGVLVKEAHNQGVDKQTEVEVELKKPSAVPIPVVERKSPDVTHQRPRLRYAHSKPFPSSAGHPPRHAHPVASVIPVFLGRPHAQTAYTPPWMRRLSKGPRPI